MGMERTELVRVFNEQINTRNLEGLLSCMSEAHRFVDTAGRAFEGKQRAAEAWKGFFELFPDYRNHFEKLIEQEGRVVVIGHSTCSEKSLEGKGLWEVEFDEDKIAKWRVYEDTPENRKLLGV